MKIKNKKTIKDIEKEYNFESMTGGIKGKYAKEYAKGNNIVMIDPDVAKFFNTTQKVNDALRQLIQLTKKVKAA